MFWHLPVIFWNLGAGKGYKNSPCTCFLNLKLRLEL